MTFKSNLQANVKQAQKSEKQALDYNTKMAVDFYKKSVQSLSKRGAVSKTYSNLIKIKGNSYTLQKTEDDGFEVKDFSLVIQELQALGLEVKLVPGVPYTQLYLNWE